MANEIQKDANVTHAPCTRVLAKLNVSLSQDPAVTLLGIYPNELKLLHTKSRTLMFTAALFIIAKTSVRGGKLWSSQTVEYRAMKTHGGAVNARY